MGAVEREKGDVEKKGPCKKGGEARGEKVPTA